MLDDDTTRKCSELRSLISNFQLNENDDGWGPVTEPEQFKDLPYQKFSKSDRIGKIADWNALTQMDKKSLKYQSQFPVGNVGQYSYFHEDDENQFTLVDTSRTIKAPFKRFKIPKNKTKREFIETKLQKVQATGQQQKVKYSPRADRKAAKTREPSVLVKENWKLIEEIDFTHLSKLNFILSNDPIDIKICGSLEYYDKTYDRLSSKNPKKLVRTKRDFLTVTTSDDSIMRQLAKSDCNVFATDSIISTLMCCTRSVYPWDVVVTKIVNKIFFDKHDSNFDLLTVSETAAVPPEEDDKPLNSPKNLSLEATYVNHNFSQQVLLATVKRYSFPDPNPFMTQVDESELPSVAYRYRKWNLGDGVKMVIRSELDAVTLGPNNNIQFLNIKALNEWDFRYSNAIDWRSKLDSQPGAVLASEIRNNGCKIAKWTVRSLLSGADQLKIGFVSRLNSYAADKHVILSTQQFKPIEFSSQIALNIDNSWGIVRSVIDFFMKQSDGKYVIIKDPNKPIIRIYQVPENEFSEEESVEEDVND